MSVAAISRHFHSFGREQKVYNNVKLQKKRVLVWCTSNFNSCTLESCTNSTSGALKHKIPKLKIQMTSTSKYNYQQYREQYTTKSVGNCILYNNWEPQWARQYTEYCTRANKLIHILAICTACYTYALYICSNIFTVRFYFHFCYSSSYLVVRLRFLEKFLQVLLFFWFTLLHTYIAF